MRAIVLEDHAISAILIRDTLEKLGFSVECAEDYDEATRALETDSKVDLIVADFHLPGPSGGDFYDWARAQPCLKSVPFLLCTADFQGKAVLSSAKRGILHYLAKPFKPVHLRQKVKDCLGKRLPKRTRTMIRMGLNLQEYNTMLDRLTQLMEEGISQFSDQNAASVMREIWPDLRKRLRNSA